MANNAPGKHYRKGISLTGIFKMFPDSDTAEKWFAKQRWGDTPACPHCGSINVQTGAKHKTMPYRCREKECAKRFSVKVGTVMQDSNLDYQVWGIAMYLMVTNLKGISSMKLHRELDITQKSAWHLAHRLREGLKAGNVQFSGPIEVDETFIGGKRANMSNSKRKALAGTGRGGAGKAIVIGAKDRASNQVSAKTITNTDQPTLHGFVGEVVDQASTVYTDDHRGYLGLPNPHKSVKHSVSEYVNGMAHTNGIESFWALLKRGYHGIYHHMSPKHLQRYVQEFAGRHNNRELDTVEMFEDMAHKMEGKRLTYRELVS
ncbi:MAG: IS1595 family transposase [Gammaproteobacteria bacterium]|nr:IS1595 family transposase [Gammaproteobacteria bacterium]